MPRLRPFLAAALLLAAGCAPSPDPAGWRPLFDGRSLAGWVPSGFDAEGAVRVEPDFRGGGPAILLQRGTTATGITWTRGAELPPSFAAKGGAVRQGRIATGSVFVDAAGKAALVATLESAGLGPVEAVGDGVRGGA